MFKKLLLAVAILAAPALSFGQTCTTDITNNFAIQTLGVGGTDSVSLSEPLTPTPTPETGTLTCPGIFLTSYSVAGGPQNVPIVIGGSTMIDISGGVQTYSGVTLPIISDQIQLSNATLLTGGSFGSSITFTSNPNQPCPYPFTCTLADEPAVMVNGLFNNQPIRFTFSGTSEFPIPAFPPPASDFITLDYVHTPAVTPEPASIMLFGTGLLSIVLLLRKVCWPRLCFP